jgi:phospholipid/cholesterol/gamma-HCH transport system permease protein
MKDLGKYFIFLGNLFVNRESFRTYYRLTVEECILIGINSIMLFALVSTFMGAVTTVQTAFNLIAPYIPKYVISQVVREMAVLELAPTIMAIIYAGKVGSSMAGNLGTMRITEQVDALEVMGINSISYLVLPKVVASLLMYPLLVILSNCLCTGGRIHCCLLCQLHYANGLYLWITVCIQSFYNNICVDEVCGICLPSFHHLLL